MVNFIPCGMMWRVYRHPKRSFPALCSKGSETRQPPTPTFFMIPNFPLTFSLLSLCAACLIPAALPAQSILLSADDFALLGGSTITGSTGTVVSNGNVGVSPGTSIIGFPPGIVINGEIVSTDSVTARAAADLATVSGALAAMTSTANLTGLDLGGMILLPGVYTFDSTAGLTGTLVLDAGGQDNAAWVFQIGSALTTAAGSSVSLVNQGAGGASGLGIFWNAGTQITTGADNLLMGNFLAGSGITFGASNSIAGSALTGGAIVLDGTAIDAMGGPGGAGFNGGLMYGGNGGIVAVPEASSLLFAASGLALALVARRRKSVA